MKGSEFVFDYVYLLLYKYHKINRNRGGSRIVKLELLTEVDMLLMAEKEITRGICHAIQTFKHLKIEHLLLTYETLIF